MATSDAKTCSTFLVNQHEQQESIQCNLWRHTSIQILSCLGARQPKRFHLAAERKCSQPPNKKIPKHLWVVTCEAQIISHVSCHTNVRRPTVKIFSKFEESKRYNGVRPICGSHLSKDPNQRWTFEHYITMYKTDHKVGIRGATSLCN